MSLNEPQQKAVHHTKGPLLVFAGAGSGKTRVIVHRIVHLITQQGVFPSRILGVTFTNKAAAEMRARLEEQLGVDTTRSLWLGTFHAVCARLLRMHGKAVQLESNFVIYDTVDQKSVVTRVLKELNLDEKRYAPRMVLARIHKEKQEGRGIQNMLRTSYVDDIVGKVYARYQKHLRSAHAVDFEDLIGRMVELVEHETCPEAQVVRGKFEYLLVDEFQDTNTMQYRLLRALARAHRNLCVVGDDDQSIYRWRGADVHNILRFKKDFPETAIIKLEQNYRSSQRIVRAALGVIAEAQNRERKELWTDNEEGELIDVVGVQNEREEAAYMVDRLRTLLAQGISLQYVAIFYRVHAQSRVLEEVLRAANIPYQVIGGTRFYERAEIKDAVAYLRLLVNPTSDVDLLRVINVPARGIGATTLAKLVSVAHAQNRSLVEIVRSIEYTEGFSAAIQKKLAAFSSLLDRLSVQAKTLAPSDMLDSLLRETGYKEMLREENSAESEARLENLKELKSSLLDVEAEILAEGDTPSLAGYLERISLQSGIEGENGEGRVQLMTVHSAKGLEFDTVILTGMEEDMFPYQGANMRGEEELEEERRLAYVAITRARRKLILIHARMRQIFGTTRWGRSSRFLEDIPFVHICFQGLPLSTQVSPAVPFPLSSARSSASLSSLKPVDGFVPHPKIARGTVVLHARFGKGTVERFDPSGEGSVVAVFPGFGRKKIMLSFLTICANTT